jgi:hypothetical protein
MEKMDVENQQFYIICYIMDIIQIKSFYMSIVVNFIIFIIRYKIRYIQFVIFFF